jgi:hypothetical protein
MTKPFEMQALIDRLKAQGMTEAEQLAKMITTEVFGWVEDSLALEVNPLYKVAIPVIEFLKPLALAAEDKIDGIAGN